MDKQYRADARELCLEVLASTDAVMVSTSSSLSSLDLAHLIALRVRARQLLPMLPDLTTEEERDRALAIERWGVAPHRRPRQR